MATKSKILPADLHVGQRIKMQRRLLGINQTDLAKAIGVTFQQVQKYENGKNRVSSSRLQAISHTLRVPPAFFFEGLGGFSRKDTPDYLTQISNTPGGLRLAKAFTAIKKKSIQRSIVALVESAAGTPEATRDE